MSLELILGLNAVILFFLLAFGLKQWLSQHRSQQFYSTHQDQLKHLQKQLEQQELTLKQGVQDKILQFEIKHIQASSELKEQLQDALHQHRTRFDERQLETFKILHDTLQKGTQENRQQVKDALNDYAQEISKRVEQLTAATDNRLKEINFHVEKRLHDGFEKTNTTFQDIIQRLAMIDAAQQKISELSTNVISLQDILNDKRSRGAFGEIQLSALIRNVLPEQHFAFQHTLSNGKRADCILFLPEPTGNIAIDAKFPLENYQILIDRTLSEPEREQAGKQFKHDIRKHIQDIAEKYIIPGETSDGAMMFIPSESVFNEIHAHHIDLVETAHRSRVWLVSPTTMMAILTTARAVLKDAATKKQLHLIQKHLSMLASDFERFQIRMDNLTKRIALAHTDADQVHISAKKIAQRFQLIEKAELTEQQLFEMAQQAKEEVMVEA